MATTTPEETTALLTRLSQKPGVQSTLVLSRTSGSIVRTTGLLSRDESVSSESTVPATPQSDSKSALDANGTSKADNGVEGKQVGTGLRNAEDVAKLVWGFFGAAGAMVEEMMGTEDEVRLLRLRTRKNELVIVPDSKFLLVVVHDTPPA